MTMVLKENWFSGRNSPRYNKWCAKRVHTYVVCKRTGVWRGVHLPMNNDELKTLHDCGLQRGLGLGEEFICMEIIIGKWGDNYMLSWNGYCLLWRRYLARLLSGWVLFFSFFYFIALIWKFSTTISRYHHPYRRGKPVVVELGYIEKMGWSRYYQISPAHMWCNTLPWNMIQYVFICDIPTKYQSEFNEKGFYGIQTFELWMGVRAAFILHTIWKSQIQYRWGWRA